MSKPNPQDKPAALNQPFGIEPNYEIFNLAVVLFSLINLPLLWLLPLPEQKNVVLIVENVISVYLLLDACYRLARAPSKKRFLWGIQGWLYFVGSLPIPLLRILRLVPVALAARHLKRSEYIEMGNDVAARPAQNALAGVVLASLTVLEVGSILILSAESSAPNANIMTASDALWWGIVTIGTIGYGDRYPVTQEGRMFGVFVIFAGVALFSVLTSFLAQWFIKARRQPQGDDDAAQMEWSNQLRALQEAMERRDEEQRRLIQELKAQVEALQPLP